MKKNNLLTKSLFTLTFVTAINAPIANAVEASTFQDTATHTAVTATDAQKTLTTSLEENLNLVVSSISVDLHNDLTQMMATATNKPSLDVELASSQPIKDDKVISSVSE